MFVQDEDFRDAALYSHMGFGLGEALAAVGLYEIYSGTDQTTPIVRTGTLAMRPEEPVPLKASGGRPATREWLYLAELRSIGGMSGAPVFAQHRFGATSGSFEISLLGVLLGGWDRILGRTPDRINEGIAMVAPAWILKQILEREVFALEREREDEAERAALPQQRRHRVREDSPEMTQGDWEAALHSATRLTPPAESAQED